MPRPEGAVRLFSHLITAQNKWMARINRDPNEARMTWFEPPFPLDELGERWEESLRVWLQYLERETEDGLARELHWTAVDGKFVFIDDPRRRAPSQLSLYPSSVADQPVGARAEPRTAVH